MKTSLILIFLTINSFAGTIISFKSTKGEVYVDEIDRTIVKHTDIKAVFNDEEYRVRAPSKLSKDILCSKLQNSETFAGDLMSDITYSSDTSQENKILIDNSGNINLIKSRHHIHYIHSIKCITHKTSSQRTPKPKEVCNLIRKKFKILGKKCDSFIKNIIFNNYALSICKEIATDHATDALNCLYTIGNVNYSKRKIQNVKECIEDAENYRLKKIKCLKR